MSPLLIFFATELTEEKEKHLLKLFALCGQSKTKNALVPAAKTSLLGRERLKFHHSRGATRLKLKQKTRP
jgi:hypothetical protein